MDRQTGEERSKLTAALLNGLALAVLVTSVITPAIRWLGSAGELATCVLGGVAALGLHLLARRLLGSRSTCLKRAAPQSSGEHHHRPPRR